MTPWLDRITIDESSELIDRERSPLAAPDRCGALPAKAFTDRYGAGCLRPVGHEGPHAPTAQSASRLDTAAQRRARRQS
jgi:hypothetical protein